MSADGLSPMGARTSAEKVMTYSVRIYIQDYHLNCWLSEYKCVYALVQYFELEMEFGQGWMSWSVG